MNTTRRGFLAALAALPVVGKMFGSAKTEPLYVEPATGPWTVMVNDGQSPVTIRYYYYNARTGEQTEILPMTQAKIAEWQHRQYECERMGRRYRVRQI